ncbi:MAG TPA: FliM/FliN family flagellar motor switch protein [Pyrinomonadaceae bacterium]|jgi:flagellar motor switch/type III secretory pathway protein FliN
MKTSERTIAAEGEAEETRAPGDLSLDPFAVDIFGKESAVETEETPPHAIEAAPFVDLRINRSKSASWFAALPRVARREAEFSNSFLELPDNLSAPAAKKIEETIAYYTLRAPHNVKCAVISAAEVNLAEAVGEAAKAPHVFLTLACQPDNSRALIAINADFAASIINSVLIDDDTTVFAIRELSAIERTIIEFLGISVLGEVNNLLDQALFRLQSVATEASEPFAANERGAEIVVSLNFGTFSGALSLFVSRRFLATLSAATRGSLTENVSNKNVLQTLERFVPKLSLHALIGTTRLSGADLNYLEPDDIIIVDQPEIDWQSAAFQGNLQVYLGSGRNFRLGGSVNETGSDAELKLKIEEISFGEERSAAPAAISMQMNETENNLAEIETGERAPEAGEQFAGETAEENPAAAAAALENVLVTLRVELGASKISLRELQNLRAGQIISLGARPTDPVRILTDASEQPVATGELIEIEGQLGVRLTKIFI